MHVQGVEMGLNWSGTFGGGGGNFWKDCITYAVNIPP